MAQPQDFPGLNLQVRGRSLHDARQQRLMQQNPAVGQHKPLAGFAAGKQHRSHTGGLTDTVRGYIAPQKLHRIVDRQSRRNHAAGRIDIKVNIRLIVLIAQKQHLRDDQVGHVVIDAAAEKDNAVLQQTGINIVGPLAAAALFDNYRY